ncbi:MAG: hypothetical protein WCL16_05370 [bacterium]
MNKPDPPPSSKQPRQPYRNRTPLSTPVERPPDPVKSLPQPRKIRIRRMPHAAAPLISSPAAKRPAGTPLRIVRALAWIILAVILAGTAATAVAYVHLKRFQARLDEVDGWMVAGNDTSALFALRAMDEPAARHGVMVREVGTRTVRVLVRLGRINEAEDVADALAALVPPDDAEPWAFASLRDVISLPQWVAGDTLYGAERMAWDRWAGYRELLACLCARDRLEMEKVRVLLAARHPDNPLCPGKLKPVIREADNQDAPITQTGQNPPSLPLAADPVAASPALLPLPVPLPPPTPTPAPASAPARAVGAAPATQADRRNLAIVQLHKRQSEIQAQLKNLHADNDSAPVKNSLAQIRLDQCRAEMQKIARKSESVTGDQRVRALEQLRQMKYKEMQLQRDAGPQQAAPSRQVVALRSELAGIEEQLNALETEPVVSK